MQHFGDSVHSRIFESVPRKVKITKGFVRSDSLAQRSEPALLNDVPGQI